MPHHDSAGRIQAEWSNLGTAELPQLIAAWNTYQQHGMLTVDSWPARPSWPPECHYNATFDCPAGGLVKDWDKKMGATIDAAMPWIANGTIKGIFLGDHDRLG